MRNIIKTITALLITFVVVLSCDYDDTNYAMLTKKVDPNATYYIQFIDASQELEVEDVGGELVDIETTVAIKLLGTPRAQDVTINLSVDPSTTAGSDMYVLGSTSLVIPAGQTSASTTFTTVGENMPVDEALTLVLNMDSGDNTATEGGQLAYGLKRLPPCQPKPGVYTIEMHDSYGDGWQTDDPNGGNGITIDIDGTIIEIGMCNAYVPVDYDCTENDGYNATTTITIPEGTLSAKWFFPGDRYGEISFEVYDPEGVKIFSIAEGEGVAGDITVESCL